MSQIARAACTVLPKQRANRHEMLCALCCLESGVSRGSVPYIVTFTRPVSVADRQSYINECCVGGDVVLDRLLPSLRERYGSDLASVQEDWGWFVWFEAAGVKLAIDVHTHDPAAGEFQVHLTSRRPRRLFGSKVEDTPELEELRELVLGRLLSWPVEIFAVERVDAKYMPV